MGNTCRYDSSFTTIPSREGACEAVLVEQLVEHPFEHPFEHPALVELLQPSFARRQVPCKTHLVLSRLSHLS
jgi:hypothetical protein